MLDIFPNPKNFYQIVLPKKIPITIHPYSFHLAMDHEHGKIKQFDKFCKCDN